MVQILGHATGSAICKMLPCIKKKSFLRRHIGVKEITVIATKRLFHAKNAPSCHPERNASGVKDLSKTQPMPLGQPVTINDRFLTCVRNDMFRVF